MVGWMQTWWVMSVGATGEGGEQSLWELAVESGRLADAIPGGGQAAMLLTSGKVPLEKTMSRQV